MIMYGSHEGTVTIYVSHGCLTSMCGNQVRLSWMSVAQVNLGWRHGIQARATSVDIY